MLASRRRKKEVYRHTCIVEPFDIAMFHTRDGQGLLSLQNRFATWLRGLAFPARFVYWQMPADLRARIDYVADLSRQEQDPLKKQMLMESRRNYEQLQNGANYHRSLCGIATWTDDSMTSETVARSVAASFDTLAYVSPWPKLFESNYRLSEGHSKFRHWHMRPIGRPGGRMYFAFLSSYEFLPVDWNFYRPLSQILSLPYPMALCVDVPRTYDRSAAISFVEGTLLATRVRLSTSTGEDSKSAKKYNDCRQTLEELNQGDLLHEVQLIIAVAAPDRESLKKSCDDIISRNKPYFKLRYDVGLQQANAARFFLEPMGHGEIVARALGAPLFVPSPSSTNLNPLDIMFPDPTEQITHVIRIVETMLGRQSSGTQQGNHQKALIGQALVRLYALDRGVELFSIAPHQTPIIEDLCDMLLQIEAKLHIQQIARDIADEIVGLCTGAGPYAKFVNARTNLDLSFRGKSTPRIFSFHEMSNDPELLAIAYTQVLTAIRRDSLADEVPRTIAVDEVYRLMRHPSLLDFLVEAVKTFRTRRKKVIVMDQQMRIFLESAKARLLFENCPIRVIFNQRNGMDVFREHVAFQHLTEQHLETIASLRRGHFILDIQDQGVFFLYMRP
ncbi:MAG: hypothetical protein Q9P01_09240 [Anaerolineae bacterium]|nr:hypothetical protein [Anaerolineae bacterium]MDQ7035000.1 hypothetical protein [Anaerolineae bacterium]